MYLKSFLAITLVFCGIGAYAQSVQMKINSRYLNIPVGNHARMRLVTLHADGQMKREFPVQIAEDSISYWIYIDVSEFTGKTIELTSPVGTHALRRIYQADKIAGADSLYHEYNRPQFHFTVKRGWSNDINGPIYYNGRYHLFWQAFPFGLLWNTGFMYWGHAISKDLTHWEEQEPALMLDSLGSPWSGTAIIDKNNDGGWGKNTLVLFYTAFDRVSWKQVQCIAYSTDNGKTFTRVKGNPVIDSNWDMQTMDTRDPKVFWYEPKKIWVLVLFEKDGMSIYNSVNLKNWEKKSHFKGLHECPDFFELPVEGMTGIRKWILHGGSSEYFVGSFDGTTFTPETEKLRYAEGKSEKGDYLYAAESFQNMPDNRTVQIAWGRIVHPGMPFTQMMLFPTEFTLVSTDSGPRLRANPVTEIDSLHQTTHLWESPTIPEVNRAFSQINAGPLHLKLDFALPKGNDFIVRYQGNEIVHLTQADLLPGENNLEILLDKTVGEIFINGGMRYIVMQLLPKRNEAGLELESEKYGPALRSVKLYEMKSIWPENAGTK